MQMKGLRDATIFFSLISTIVYHFPLLCWCALVISANLYTICSHNMVNTPFCKLKYLVA